MKTLQHSQESRVFLVPVFFTFSGEKDQELQVKIIQTLMKIVKKSSENPNVDTVEMLTRLGSGID